MIARLPWASGGQRAAWLLVGVVGGVALALALGGPSWEAGAVGLGFVLAAVAGVAQTCSA